MGVWAGTRPGGWELGQLRASAASRAHHLSAQSHPLPAVNFPSPSPARLNLTAASPPASHLPTARRSSYSEGLPDMPRGHDPLSHNCHILTAACPYLNFTSQVVLLRGPLLQVSF